MGSVTLYVVVVALYVVAIVGWAYIALTSRPVKRFLVVADIRVRQHFAEQEVARIVRETSKAMRAAEPVRLKRTRFW